MTQTFRKKPLDHFPSGDNGRLHILIKGALFAALGALCASAELLFGARPFGVALAAGATSLFPAVALGAAAYALAARDVFSLVSLFILSLFRVIATLAFKRHGAYALFEEPVRYRAVAAAVALLFSGAWRLAATGFRYYYLLALLFSLFTAALATLLFVGIFEKHDDPFPHAAEIGYAALFFVAVFALRKLDLFGVYPAALAVALASFLLVAHRGGLLGAAGALLAGLAFSPRLSPAFLLLAVAFALLQKSSRGGGVVAGCAAATAYAFALFRESGIAILLPSLLTAGALFLAGDSAGLVEGSASYRAGVTQRRAARQSAKAERDRATECRMNDISGALLDLSHTFFELSARLRRPSFQDLKHLCDRAFDGVCPNCPHRALCWGNEYGATAKALDALAERLQENGAAKKEHMPAVLAARCPTLDDILKEINENAVLLLESKLRGDKTTVVAADYAALGRVLFETLEDTDEAYSADDAAGKRILDRLTRQGYILESAALCGTRQRRVILRGIRLPGRRIKLRDLKRTVEGVCRFSLDTPTVSEGEGVLDIIFPERERFRCKTVQLNRPKGRGEGKYSGDNVHFLSSRAGCDYSLLLDGMGSGNMAALTSTLGSTFLSRMLEAGGRADTSLRMLNGFLAARGARESEASTTVDLLEIDRVSGEASFYKCGAAPSFLLRRGEVTRFFSRTAPLGILESLDAERIRFTVEAGDVILQVSDGVTRGEEDCPWLSELLSSRFDGKDPEKFARAVLHRAGAGVKDDLSLILTVVGENIQQAERESA